MNDESIESYVLFLEKALEKLERMCIPFSLGLLCQITSLFRVVFLF